MYLANIQGALVRPGEPVEKRCYRPKHDVIGDNLKITVKAGEYNVNAYDNAS